MHDTSARVEMVKRRVRKLRRQRAGRALGRLLALCIALFTALMFMLDAAVDTTGGVIYGMSGAMLLHEDVGGYVLVGVLSFTAAVVITVLCMRSREKTKRRDEKKEESEE